MTPTPDREIPGRRQTGVLITAAVLAFVAIHAALVVGGISPVQRGELADTDAYTWVNRTTRLLETGAWFDGTEPRSNAPFGESSHWTRPLDVLTVAVAAPAIPFVGVRRAVFLAAAVVPPLLGLLLCATMVWAAGALLPRAALPLVALAVFAQPLPTLYAVAGRLDHHLLILVLFGLTFGWLVQAVTNGGRAHAAALAGVAAGAGLWVSTEFLATLIAVQLGIGILWLRDGDTGTARRFAAALLATTAVAAILERGMAAFTAVEYDRISLPHVVLVALVPGFWTTLARIPARTPVRRAAAAVLTASAVVLLMVVLFPGFERGPFAQVDPATRSLWLTGVTELHGLFGGGGGSAGPLFYFLGPALVALPWGIRMCARDAQTRRPGWLLFSIALAVFAGLAVVQVRWSLYVQVLGAVGLAGALHALLTRLETVRPPVAAAVARVVLVAGALTGFALAGWLLEDRGAPPARTAATGTCTVRDIAVRLPGRTGVILALMDFGPELLYRTPHSVIATPYHRNPGIVASHRMLTAHIDDARAEIAARGVSWILLCPARDAGFFGSTDPESLYNRLVDGRLPDGVRRLELAGPTGFELFEIVRGRLDPSAAAGAP